MTDTPRPFAEQRAEIEKRLVEQEADPYYAGMPVARDLAACLAEVDRLQQENEFLVGWITRGLIR